MSITKIPQTLVALVLTCVMFGTGCSIGSTTTVVTDIQKFIPAVTNVLTAICAFQPTNALCATGVADFETAANNAITLTQAYLAAVKAGTATSAMWNDVNAAFLTVEGNAVAIFAAVHFTDPKAQAEVEALVASAQVLLAVIETLEPASVGGAQPKAAHFAKYLPQGKINRKWLNTWKQSYNARVDAAVTANARVKLAHIK